MDANRKLLELVNSTFAEDPEVLGVAMYLTSSMAVVEATQSSALQGHEHVGGVPPAAMETMYMYESACVKNKFYLDNYAVIKGLSVLDKVKATAVIDISTVGDKQQSKKHFEVTKRLILSKFDSLIMIAFIWKGYKFAQEFAEKLYMTIELPPGLEDYFRSRGV